MRGSGCAGRKRLEARARRIESHEDVFQVLALEKWQDARRLHSTALRNRSKVALHQLRIGIKRFRYVVENFLPAASRDVGQGSENDSG